MSTPFNSRDLKRKQEKLERSHQEASSKVPLEVNGPNMSNKRESLQSAKLAETIEVRKVPNHFHRH